ncbi:MAG: tetratricopeptide repeat protein, partial [Candidatus Omnitrophica bacterium]|nr:tetratricopeptide repeat protein [Candidatus Omnitrophota bacterium]
MRRLSPHRTHLSALLFSKVILLYFITVAPAVSPVHAAQIAGPASLAQIAAALNAGQFNQAVRAYTRIGESGDCSGYRNRAVIFKDLGRYDLAIKTLLVACKAGRDDNQTLRLLGRLYFLDGQTDNAVRVLRSAVEITPDIETIVTLGLCYQAKGDDARAQEYLNAAVTLDAGNVMAHLTLADLYVRQKKLVESAREY